MMKKGETFTLIKGNRSLNKVRVCLGWTTPTGMPYDLDASCVMLTEEDKCRDIHDFICYGSPIKRARVDENGNLIFKRKVKTNEDGTKTYVDWPAFELLSRCQSVIHLGDVIGGHGSDDEQIIVELDRIPKDIKKLLFIVTLYDYQKRVNSQGGIGQSFSDIEDAYVRILDEEESAPMRQELAKYELSKTDTEGNATAFIIGEISKTRNRWGFKAIGEGRANTGIDDLFREFGINSDDTNENEYEEVDD